MTTYNCYGYKDIIELASGQQAELHLLTPETRLMLLANLRDLPTPSRITHVSSAWVDRANLTAEEVALSRQLIEAAKSQILLDSPIINNAFIVIRDKLGGENKGSNLTQVIQSIARALGAPGPDESIEREIEKIAEIL